MINPLSILNLIKESHCIFVFQISELNPQVMQMGAVCLVSCLVIRVIATFLVSFGCGLNNKEKLFIGLTWMAKATVQVSIYDTVHDLFY